MNDIIIEIKNLKKYFHTGSEELKILENLELKVKRGEIITIIGESGVGKSTLLSLISGLDRVTDGTIFVKGEDITKMSEKELTVFRANYIGFVFQFHFLLQEFTAFENVLIPILIKYKKITREFENKAKELLEYMGVKERFNHKPGELSGGECQRVALARAIITEPEIVIADEPTGNLDDKNRKVVLKLIKDLNKKYKTTFIIASHNLSLKKISHKVYKLRNKKLYKL